MIMKSELIVNKPFSQRQYACKSKRDELPEIALHIRGINMKDAYYIIVNPNMKYILGSLATMLYEGLKGIDVDSCIIDSPIEKTDRPSIVLGANFLSDLEVQSLHPESIILNVENVSGNFIVENYRRSLRRFSVWDYNASNAKCLEALIGRPVHYIKTFYVPQISRLDPNIAHDIDVLFYGSFNKRREDVLADLRLRGLNVVARFNVYGEELDRLIERSKTVINMHFYDNGHLEIIRIFDLLANHKAVVTELNDGEGIDEDLRSAMLCVPYEELATATEALLRDGQRYRLLQERGHSIFQRRSGSDILRQALEFSDRPRLPVNAVIGSGKMYDPSCLNIDIDHRWRPDVIADVSAERLLETKFETRKFGPIQFRHNLFEKIFASHVIEHIPNLVLAMTNMCSLLADGGELHVRVPYDLSYGAWQDPMHVHAFNERSWLYYCDWYWYLGWDEHRFDLIDMSFTYSSVGDDLISCGTPHEVVLRTPRAVDEMRVILRKRTLTEQEKVYGRSMRGEDRA
ncbi:hypothetical protein U8607_17540 [Methylobacterium durans]|uniref:hypothetical protein n=1 Tax=Methylobacterium durans TaxID=2202825 RepID=UPI002AFF1C79|nr:hypothetical protein [Methylobacterium durans]MEA1833893.1 hypothetical protein [Methylobacterium durans]